MAGRKKAERADEGKAIIAFVLEDFEMDEGEDVTSFFEGQRLELAPDEFAAMKKACPVVAGVFAKMNVAVEGGRYSLKPHDTVWLPPHVYDAWKAAGHCQPSENDPTLADEIQTRKEAEGAALAARDEALKKCAAAEEDRNERDLIIAAARLQVEKVRGMIEPDQNSGNVLDDEHQALLAEVVALLNLLPAVEAAKEPQGDQCKLV